jgi:hypothetical protein
MKKRDRLLKWAVGKDWFYLNEVPFDNFGMSRATASTALADFCKQGKMDFRIQGIKQYRVRS